jgi:tRNA pseudouridine13 synthase
MYKIKALPEDFEVRELSDVKASRSGRYCYFLLKKKNYTTEKAVQAVAHYLKIGRKRFGYAGNKDKTAVTEQLVSVLGRAREIRIKDIETRIIGYGEEPVSLGRLKGNEFKIVVRNLTGGEVKKIKKNCKKLREKKFLIINYFDEQRFSRNNAEVGKLIVKGKFREAVELLLEGKGEFEEKIRSYIKANPADFIGALRIIPKNILQLYVHAFQSKIWNDSAEKLGSLKTNVAIVGFGTELKGETGKVIADILENEGIEPRDFVIKKIPELSSEGSERELFTRIKDLKLSEAEDDELNKNKKKITTKFFLPKGSYATLIIKNLLCKW